MEAPPQKKRKKKKESKKENEQTLLFVKEPKYGWVGCGVVVWNFGEIYESLFLWHIWSLGIESLLAKEGFTCAGILV